MPFTQGDTQVHLLELPQAAGYPDEGGNSLIDRAPVCHSGLPGGGGFFKCTFILFENHIYPFSDFIYRESPVLTVS